MNRENLSRMTQFLTGHNKLERHKNIQKGIINPNSCRLCKEEEESSFHVIGECPALQKTRLEIFQKHQLPNPPVWEVRQVFNFIKKTPIGGMLDEAE